MSPLESAAALKGLIERAAQSLSTSSARVGFTQAFDLFSRGPAVGCTGPEEDMLLFQWGVYDWGDGEFFELNLTRQFIEPIEGEPCISQLHLTFNYEPTPALRALGAGNRWCQGSEDLPRFRSFVVESAPYVTLADHPAVAVELVHSPV